MVIATKYEVDVDGKFRKSVDEAIGEVEDLRVPFGLIAASWFKSNRAIFALAGPGKYQDLSPNYKPRKKKAVGFIYPILRRTGRLERSITDQNDNDAIVRIGKQTLVMGSGTPWAYFHQAPGPRKKIPLRPVVLIGAESIAPQELNNRRELWIKTVADYVEQKMKKRFG